MKLLLMALAAHTAAPPAAVPVRMAGIAWKVVETPTGCALESPVINGAVIRTVRLEVQKGLLRAYGLKPVRALPSDRAVAPDRGTRTGIRSITGTSPDGFLVFHTTLKDDAALNRYAVNAQAEPLLVAYPGENLQVEKSVDEATLRALAACTATRVSKLYDMPIDPEAVLQVAIPKEKIQMAPDDYPSAAVEKGVQGRLQGRIAVSADGQPGKCLVTETTGLDALDSVVCKKLKAARYQPARDRDGKPINGLYSFDISFSLDSGFDAVRR